MPCFPLVPNLPSLPKAAMSGLLKSIALAIEKGDLQRKVPAPDGVSIRSLVALVPQEPEVTGDAGECAARVAEVVRRRTTR